MADAEQDQERPDGAGRRAAVRDVEVDETAGGAKHVRASDRAKGRQHVIAKVSRRPTIWGAVERKGRVRVQVVKSRGIIDVEGAIYTHVLPSSIIFTDEWGGYSGRISRHYAGHRRIRHEDRVYVSGAVHTQTIEGFFGLVKSGIRGTYHAVSSKWLQGYLNEYAWRYTTAKTGGRSSSRYFFGRRGTEGILSPFRRSRTTSSRLGTGISSPFSVRCLGSRLS